MAKQQFPMMKSGGGALSKLVGVLLMLAVLTLVVKHPAESAHWFSGALSTLGTAVEGLATFLQQVLG